MPTPAGPGTNQFRCNACGRYFNTQEELSTHEVECRAAKTATREGAAELAQQDAEPHAPNDQNTRDIPWKEPVRSR